MRFCPQCGLIYREGHRICPLDGEQLKERDDPFLGRIIAGKYRIIELIGEGGIGRVYRARHVHMDLAVAVKVLPEEASLESDTKERFIREARAADMVGHENIVEILDLGETTEGIPYMIMELLEGLGLEILIGKHTFPMHRAVRVMRQVCSVLGPTHAMGIIHRDLKPENIFLIDRNDRSDFVKVLDFGVAHLAHEPGITREGMVLGTPHYMAPELAMGHTPTAGVDLYALGCIAYEMIAGHPPFHDGNVFEIMTQQINKSPPRLSSVVPDVPPEYDEIVSRLLVKDPARRYLDAYALVRDLDAFMPPPRDPSLRLSTPGFVPGTTIEGPKPAMTPDMLQSWKDFAESSRQRASSDDRRLVYEMEELTGQLESIFGMMESILTVMGATQEKSRRTGRHIRFAIDRLAHSASIARASLGEYDTARTTSPELEDLSGQIAELCRQLEAVTVESDSHLVEQQARIETLEADREKIEAELCELSMRIGTSAGSEG
jgi:serine/threonine-protein kinase